MRAEPRLGIFDVKEGLIKKKNGCCGLYRGKKDAPSTKNNSTNRLACELGVSDPG